MSKIVELYVRELTREGSTMTINDVAKTVSYTHLRAHET